jgi:hypothetical protein
MRRQLANPVGMTTYSSIDRIVRRRMPPFRQRQRDSGSKETDLMIASSGLAACRAICNLRELQRLRHNYRRGVGERECLA